MSNNNRQVLDPHDSLTRHERRSMSYISGSRSRPCASAKSVLEHRTWQNQDLHARRRRSCSPWLARFSPGSTVDADDCSEAAIAGSANVSNTAVLISKRY
ncbi:hypothetical protein BDN71DRAFT_1457309 [Pleurotus eryngii]|uniref:Uncharacterized protein n=1 Tax=Pleurotus eryngii TaxID=5323 RepID=A0A9P5ZKU3_PLEER|nr:hypothetical protein BDN71DRAFT_1457309 [Pleurotus eryngii]